MSRQNVSMAKQTDEVKPINTTKLQGFFEGGVLIIICICNIKICIVTCNTPLGCKIPAQIEDRKLATSCKPSNIKVASTCHGLSLPRSISSVHVVNPAIKIY